VVDSDYILEFELNPNSTLTKSACKGRIIPAYKLMFKSYLSNVRLYTIHAIFHFSDQKIYFNLLSEFDQKIYILHNLKLVSKFQRGFCDTSEMQY